MESVSPRGVAASSCKISRQSSTHSSQMKTESGPAIKRLTCSWLRPQNEQNSSARRVRLIIVVSVYKQGRVTPPLQLFTDVRYCWLPPRLLWVSAVILRLRCHIPPPLVVPCNSCGRCRG